MHTYTYTHRCVCVYIYIYTHIKPGSLEPLAFNGTSWTFARVSTARHELGRHCDIERILSIEALLPDRPACEARASPRILPSPPTTAAPVSSQLDSIPSTSGGQAGLQPPEVDSFQRGSGQTGSSQKCSDSPWSTFMGKYDKMWQHVQQQRAHLNNNC